VPDEAKSHSVTYADAGVDISSGDRAKERIKYLAQKTFNRNVLGGIGGFGALFRLDLQRWNGDNEGEITLAKVGKAILDRWSPQGLDAQAFPWDNPLQSNAPSH